MIFRFKSPATADLIMLETDARRLLEIIGKEPTPEGIILREQIPGALQALSDAVNTEANSRPAASTAEDAVTLKRRAKPFVDMLRRCENAQASVVWGT